MSKRLRDRRVVALVVALISFAIVLLQSPELWQQNSVQQVSTQKATGAAVEALATIPTKGRAPKTGYTRAQFGDGWQTRQGCDVRNIILNRDMTDVTLNETCKVLTGTLHDPYTATEITFTRGESSSSDVQIDHVVAISDAWQKGAQQLTAQRREQLANDPLELLAVQGKANQDKSDGDAATWLPPNKAFRCQYVARQIAVKAVYGLWVTVAEREAMEEVLAGCPGEPLPVE